MIISFQIREGGRGGKTICIFLWDIFLVKNKHRRVTMNIRIVCQITISEVIKL